MKTTVQWVDVRDAVPDTARVVLVVWGGQIVGHARRRTHDGAWFLVIDGRAVDVTYWAELPEPPEDMQP